MSGVTVVQSQSAKGQPYSLATRFGDFIFTHGQTGRNPASGELVPGGIGPETRQAIENLRQILASSGTSLEQVIKVTVYLADFGEFQEFNKAYLPYFRKHQPARTVVEVAALHTGARVEMDMIAGRVE